MRYYLFTTFLFLNSILFSSLASGKSSTYENRCYFPAAIQSWSSNSKLDIDKRSSVSAPNVKMNGAVAIGHITGTGTCDGRKCISNHSLLINTPRLHTAKFGSQDFLGGRAGKNESNVIAAGEYDEVKLKGGNYYFSGGKYFIRTLEINSATHIIVDEKSHIVVNKAEIRGFVTFTVKGNNPDNFILWAENEGNKLASIKMRQTQGTLTARVFSRDTFIAEEQVTIKGAVTAKSISLGESSHINHEVGECQPDIKPPVHKPPEHKPYRYSISPKKVLALNCRSAAPTFTVQTFTNGVLASRELAILIRGHSAGDFGFEIDKGKRIAKGRYKSDENGQFEFKFVSVRDNIPLNKEIQVGVGPDNKHPEDFSAVSFVPYKFDIPVQRMVAGRTKTVTGEVLACDGKERSISIPYSGKPTLTYKLKEPKNGKSKSFHFAPEFKNGELTEASNGLNFNNTGLLEVQLEDSNFNCEGIKKCPIDGKDTLKGEFEVKSRPWTFAICDRKGKALPQGSSTSGDAFVSAGSTFSLKVKPIKWVNDGKNVSPFDKKAVNVQDYCDAPVPSNFSLEKSPPAQIIISNGGQAVSPKDGTVGDGIKTKNTDNSITKVKPLKHDQALIFKRLIWQDVGSIRVQANTVNKYLDMDINQGYINLGRFYPTGLRYKYNTWEYQGGLNKFAYMNQPIGAKVVLEAVNILNKPVQNYWLKDYTMRSDLKFIAQDHHGNSLLNRIALPAEGWVKGNSVFADKPSSEFVIYDPKFKFLKRMTTNTPYTTTPDGPYAGVANDQFGMVVTNKKDDVDFLSKPADQLINWSEGGRTLTGVEFPTQPDFRYGRMVLDDVNGPLGEAITVPLLVEYWNGGRFITNKDDSGSQFKPNIYYVMSNSNTSTAKLTASNPNNFYRVNQGKSNELKANQTTNKTETVRLFVRQGNDGNALGNNPKPQKPANFEGFVEGWKNAENVNQPWLQFNWRQLGDEDPSSIVNFDSMQGNNRLIYRGELTLR
ncbi:MAG: DUF6701 domain-containing protein [Vibrio sp.]